MVVSGLPKLKETKAIELIMDSTLCKSKNKMPTIAIPAISLCNNIRFQHFLFFYQVVILV